MLKAFWKKLGSPHEDEPTARTAFDADAVRMLCDLFPIGRKLSYFPEFMRDIVFPTVIIGYRINGQLVYSHDAVERDQHGDVAAFRTGPKALVRLADIKSLQLLLPDTSDLEKKLDYFTRAELGRAGQFRQGNTITLLAETETRGIPTMDTTVERRQELTTGPFADTPTILVTPQLETLVIADKRRKQRVAAMIAADLHHGVDVDPAVCTLCDFSEQSLRLIPRGKTTTMTDLVVGAHVEVEFQISIDEPPYRLAGKVLRTDAEFCIVEIDTLFKDGAFHKPTPIDIVGIKTGLLNYRA